MCIRDSGSAIVAAALKNGTVLNYTAELPENKRKILYVDTVQSTYHCVIVARRSLRMAGLPTDSNHEYLEFLVLRKYTPEERIAIVDVYKRQSIHHRKIFTRRTESHRGSSAQTQSYSLCQSVIDWQQ